MKGRTGGGERGSDGSATIIVPRFVPLRRFFRARLIASGPAARAVSQVRGALREIVLGYLRAARQSYSYVYAFCPNMLVRISCPVSSVASAENVPVKVAGTP